MRPAIIIWPWGVFLVACLLVDGCDDGILAVCTDWCDLEINCFDDDDEEAAFERDEATECAEDCTFEMECFEEHMSSACYKKTDEFYHCLASMSCDELGDFMGDGPFVCKDEMKDFDNCADEVFDDLSQCGGDDDEEDDWDNS